jgi:hypothetical protein
VILALRRLPYFFETVPLVLSRLLPATGRMPTMNHIHF